MGDGPIASIAIAALIADLFFLRRTAMWLMSTSNRIKATWNGSAIQTEASLPRARLIETPRSSPLEPMLADCWTCVITEKAAA